MVIDRASLGWFAHEPEWFDLNNLSFAESEAQSVSVFVHHLLHEGQEASLSDSKGRGRDNGTSTGEMVRSFKFTHNVTFCSCELPLFHENADIACR